MGISANIAVGVLGVLSIWIICAYQSIHFFSRKSEEPIHSRRPGIVIIAIISACLSTAIGSALNDILLNYAASSNLMVRPSIEATLIVGLSYVAFAITATIFVIRAFLLWVDAEIGRESIEFIKTRNSMVLYVNSLRKAAGDDSGKKVEDVEETQVSRIDVEKIKRIRNESEMLVTARDSEIRDRDRIVSVVERKENPKILKKVVSFYDDSTDKKNEKDQRKSIVNSRYSNVFMGKEIELEKGLLENETSLELIEEKSGQDFVSEKRNTHDSSRTSNGIKMLKKKWFFRFRNYFNGERVWVFVLSALSFQTLLIIFLIRILFDFIDDYDLFFQMLSIVFSIVFFAQAAIFCISFLKLRECEENFGLKTELFRVGIALAISHTLKIIDAGTVNWMSHLFFQIFKVHCFNLVIDFFVYLFIVYESLHKVMVNHKPIESPAKVNSEEEFDIILNSEIGLEHFENFLRKEFSIENILFYQDVLEYKKGNLASFEIFDTYIASSAPLQVNLSGQVRNKLRQFFKDRYNRVTLGYNVNHDLEGKAESEQKLESDERRSDPLEIFDAAFYEIRGLMIRDSFMRFKCTPECISVLHAENGKLRKSRFQESALQLKEIMTKGIISSMDALRRSKEDLS